MTNFVIAPSFIKGYSYCENHALSTKFPETIIVSTNDPIGMAMSKIKPNEEESHRGIFIDTEGHDMTTAGFVLEYIEEHYPSIKLETDFM